MIINIESIYKSYKNARLGGLGAKTKWSNYKWREAQALLREATLIKVENVSLEQISIIDLNCYVTFNLFCCSQIFVGKVTRLL